MLSSIGDKISILSQDEGSRRFCLYSGTFLLLITMSCYVEEWIFKLLPGFEYPWSVALVELLLFSAWAVVDRAWREGCSAIFQRRAPMWYYVAFAIALALSQSLGKITYLYINYATATVVKSMKLVPTLAISACFLQKEVPLSEWVAAGLLVASSALMAIGEQLSDVEFQPFGLLIAALGLLASAGGGNLQERILKGYDASISEAVLFSNSIGLLFVFVVIILNGEVIPAMKYFAESPYAFFLLAFRSVTYLLGALAANVLTKEYGTGAATAVGTARKSLTLLISFALFPKPFHINYVFGVLAFISADALYLHMSASKAEKRARDNGSYTPVEKQVDVDQHNGVDPECVGASELDTVAAV